MLGYDFFSTALAIQKQNAKTQEWIMKTYQVFPMTPMHVNVTMATLGMVFSASKNQVTAQKHVAMMILLYKLKKISAVVIP